MLSRIAIAVVLLGLLQGCMTTRIGDFTVVSTKNVDLSSIDLKSAIDAPEYEGQNIKVFGIPNLEDAIDDALKKGDGNVMVDAVLYFYSGFFQHGYKVKGKVIKTK